MLRSSNLLEGTITGVNAAVFAQITESREKFDTATLFTFESGAIVYTLVGLQTVQSREILVAANNVATIRTVLCVYSDVNL